MFQPIITEEQLPKVGDRINENLCLDFKKEFNPSAAYEAAKDIAAFANTEGGTLVIGADAEHECLKEYSPLRNDIAGKAQVFYDQAVRDRCSPRPIHDIKHLRKDAGTILVINVQPFSGQLIGVKKEGDSYTFPIRVGAQTKYILPEQLAMFMEPRIRRISCCLQPAIGQKVMLHKDKDLWFASAILKDINILTNTVVVLIKPKEQESEIEVPIPLDLIDTVWMFKDTWHLLLRGQLRELCWLPDVSPEYQAMNWTFSTSP